ncbi:MAG: WD40 repeat domain-containing protein [Planctomycetia bacterium]|nr:WD40 repeat domain-containing protein [Planctomycetia bacterium]
MPDSPYRHIHLAPSRSLSRISRDGKLIIPSGGTNSSATLRKIQLHDTAKGTPVGSAITPGGIVLDADLSPDNRVLVTITTPFTTPVERQQKMYEPGAGELAFWNVETGQRIGKPVTMPSEPRSVHFRPDGQRREGFILLVELGLASLGG